MIDRLTPYLLISAGAVLGANARYLVARYVGTAVDGRFPLGTLLVNVSGSFLLGLLAGLLVQRLVPHSDAWRLALGVGFLGSYTTFSTFEFETNALLEDGLWLAALTNVLASFVAGLLALRAGVLLGRTWP